jgi:hypothetical protein
LWCKVIEQNLFEKIIEGGELNTMNNLLVNTNKSLTKLRYEEETKDTDINNMLDILQLHIFLVQTCINKPEFQPTDVKVKLLDKLRESKKS